MNNTTSFLKSVQDTLTKHSPEILTGIGIAGMITTTILAVRATPKALKLIEEEKKKQDKEKLTAGETVKATWKCYIPSAITCASSVGCLIGANSVHMRRSAALAAAYKVTETALIEYKDKAFEVVGEKKEKEIREAIHKDRMEKQPVSQSTVIVTDKGNTLCYDYHSGRYFKSDRDRIIAAVNEVNRRMTFDMYASLNELYDELDLEHTRFGDELGWNLQDGLVKPVFSSKLADDGTPCLMLDYSITPRRGYDRL